MAALQKLTDQFLTCIVCQDVFKDPITLHCGHTFCGACITSFVLTRPDAQADKSIPCPNCRGNTKVPDPSKPVSEWAGQLKTGFFVKDLVETFVADEAIKETVLCSVCKEEGAATPADKWCTDCSEALCAKCLDLHTQYPKFRQHKTQGIEEGLKKKQAESKHFCHEHKDERLKLFCNDCDLAICQICCSVFHRKCDSVVTISEAYPQMKETLSNKVQDMHFASLRAESVLAERKSQLGALMESCDKSMSEMDAACEEFVKLVNTRKDSLKKKLRTLTDHAARLLTNDLETADSTCKETARDVITIQASVKSSTEIELYDTYKTFCSKKNPSLPEKDAESRKTPPRIMEIEFSSNMPKLINTLNTLKIGSFNTVFDKLDEPDEESDGDDDDDTQSVTSETGTDGNGKKPRKRRPKPARHEKGQKPGAAPGMHAKGKFTSSESLPGKGAREKKGPKGKPEGKDVPDIPPPALIEKIDTKADIDPHEPNIKDILVIPDGPSVIIALTDAPNKKVKALYRSTGQKTFIEFQFPPFGLTQVSPNEIAVAVKFAFRIYIIQIRPQLQITSHLDTKEGYTHICHIDSNRFVASSGGKAIDVLDSKGAILKKIENEDISAAALYKANQLGQFLVCDPISHSVSRISTNNKVSFKFEPFGKHRLVNAIGACADTKGNVYVVNRGSNKVILLNGAGKYWRDVITYRDPGEMLCFIDVDSCNRMFLSFGERMIHVYQLPQKS